MRDLVLIPGLNNTGIVFDGAIAALGDEATCLTGTSPALDDVEALAEFWLARAPARFHLCGFSFGGYVALAMLAKAPDRIQGFALACSTIAADGEAARAARSRSIDAVRRDGYETVIAAQASAAFHPESLRDQALVAARNRMVADFGVERFVAHQRAAAARPDRTGLLSTFRGAVALIGGSHDALFPPALMEALRDANPGATLTIIANAGHLAPMERPGAFAAALRTLWSA